MKRLFAYLGIAGLGFGVGITLYIVGRLVGRIIERYIPYIYQMLVNPETSGMLLSGIGGMILAVVLAYLWASR